MKVLAPLFVSLMLGACATAPSCPVVTPPLQRVQPTEAMGPSNEVTVFDACSWTLAQWDSDLNTQAALLRGCIEELGPSYRDEVAKRKVLANWIKRSP